jgi:hypothetical protein
VNDIGLIILEVAETDEDNITRCDPNLFSHFTANVAESGFTVEAISFEPSLAQHAGHLRVLWVKNSAKHEAIIENGTIKARGCFEVGGDKFSSTRNGSNTLPIFLEFEFTLSFFIVILAPSSVFTTLSCRLDDNAEGN